MSDAFAAALWAVDYAAEMSKRGVTTIDFHGAGSGAPYAPVDREGNVRPLFYGLWALADVARHGGAWLETTTTARGLSTSPVYSFGHAAFDPSTETVRAVVIVKEADGPAASANVTVDVVLAHACEAVPTSATLRRLQPQSAGDIGAKSGLAYAGQTFDGSVDGAPVGPRREETLEVVREAGGDVRVSFEATPASVNVVVVPCNLH